MNVTAVSLI